MSKRKGVSAEDKRIRMLQLFHEKNEFFQLKELEKIAPKEKGIIAQSVKDVVQSLVDDGLVETDKIGTSTYYWSYPSKAQFVKKSKLEQIENKCEELTLKLKNQKKALEISKVNKEDNQERQDALKKIEELKKVKKELEEKLKAHNNCNPVILEKLKDDIEKTKEAINKWTDNIFAIKSWCKNKFFIEGDLIDKQFDIPSDLDYIE